MYLLSFPLTYFLHVVDNPLEANKVKCSGLKLSSGGMMMDGYGAGREGNKRFKLSQRF